MIWLLQNCCKSKKELFWHFLVWTMELIHWQGPCGELSIHLWDCRMTTMQSKFEIWCQICLSWAKTSLLHHYIVPYISMHSSFEKTNIQSKVSVCAMQEKGKCPSRFRSECVLGQCLSTDPCIIGPDWPRERTRKRWSVGMAHDARRRNGLSTADDGSCRNQWVWLEERWLPGIDM